MNSWQQLSDQQRALQTRSHSSTRIHYGLILDRVESSAHLEEISEGEVFIVGRLGDRRPHLPEVLLPSLDQALQGRPCAVAEDKQQHCTPLVGRWGEELQVHL